MLGLAVARLPAEQLEAMLTAQCEGGFFTEVQLGIPSHLCIRICIYRGTYPMLALVLIVAPALSLNLALTRRPCTLTLTRRPCTSTAAHRSATPACSASSAPWSRCSTRGSSPSTRLG